MSAKSSSDELKENYELECVHYPPDVLERLMQDEIENHVQSDQGRGRFICPANIGFEIRGEFWIHLPRNVSHHRFTCLNYQVTLSVFEKTVLDLDLDLVLVQRVC